MLISFYNLCIGAKLSDRQVYSLSKFMKIPPKNVYEFLSSHYIQEKINV